MVSDKNGQVIGSEFGIPELDGSVKAACGIVAAPDGERHGGVREATSGSRQRVQQRVAEQIGETGQAVVQCQ